MLDTTLGANSCLGSYCERNTFRRCSLACFGWSEFRLKESPRQCRRGTA